MAPRPARGNHEGSTKSFDYVREHNEALNRLDLIAERAEITVEYEPGSIELVAQHDGLVLRLRKLAAEYDVHDRSAALAFLRERQESGEIVTGLLYIERKSDDLHDHLQTVPTPLFALGEAELCPGAATLDRINASLR